MKTSAYYNPYKTPSLRRLLAVILSFTLAGCMTMQPLRNDSSYLASELQKGDQLELVTLDGRQIKMIVRSVDETGINGESSRVSFSDLVEVKRQELNGTRTTLLVLGILAAGAALSSSGGGGGGSSGGGY